MGHAKLRISKNCFCRDLKNTLHSSLFTLHCFLMPYSIITIDGPAASGKSSVARAVAKKLGFTFVSSGSYYRALAWLANEQHVDFSNKQALTTWLASLNLESRAIGGEARIFLNGIDPTPHLTEASVNALVSPLAAIPAVRSFLLQKLRDLANQGSIVMEGRDIGSIVLPEATFKFYLDASLEERMRRRSHEGTVDTIATRDQQDATRALAPLSIPLGATVIDSTHLSIEEVVERITTIVNNVVRV